MKIIKHTDVYSSVVNNWRHRSDLINFDIDYIVFYTVSGHYSLKRINHEY